MRTWQKIIDPPRQFWIVVALLYPSDFFMQSAESCLNPPWVWQYLSVTWQGNLALSGVRQVLSRPPRPLPPLPHLPPFPLWPTLLYYISCRMWSISVCTPVCAAAFAAGAGGAICGGISSGLLSVTTNYCIMAIISVPCVSIVVRNWSANMLAWWNPACCIVCPCIAFSSIWASLKYFFNSAKSYLDALFRSNCLIPFLSHMCSELMWAQTLTAVHQSMENWHW